jgi:L-alanine-DL-glutamate epimerase-like enolase superfamily enzyme
VYAAGGYYRPDDTDRTLPEEIRGYLDAGYGAVKIKIGGLPVADDLARIERALGVLDSPDQLAVDANGRFDRVEALRYAKALDGLGLRWFEEAGDPLDYRQNAEVIGAYEGAVATGENLFSVQDVTNLCEYGGMRPGRDVFQMDAGLSYGLTEYLAMIDALEARGHDRRQCYPHGGHLVNLHIVIGAGLGGCEAYPGVFRPVGGYAPDCAVVDGRIRPGDGPGFGLERKAELRAAITELVH